MGQQLRRIQLRDPYIPDLEPWHRLSDENKRQLLESANLAWVERAEVCTFESSGILLSGVLGVRHELSDGRRVISSLYRPGALIDLRRSDRARQGRLVALTTADVLVLDDAVLDDAVRSQADVAAMVMDELREQGARMRDHAVDLVNKTPVERLAAFIFELARFDPDRPSRTPRQSVPVPLRRLDIAEYVGVKAETVSRVIRQLEREGLICLPDSDRIELIDAPTLRRFANGGRPRQSTSRA